MNKKKKTEMTNEKFLRFPIISQGAEYLVQGYLMRRNILTYRAPQNNEGYDLICIHSDPRIKGKRIRIQVKSRYQTDCNRSFPVKEKSLDAFDFLVVVFLNIGYFYKKINKSEEGKSEPEFYTLPASFIKKHLDKRYSWQKVMLKKLNVDKYKNDNGFELIANKLRIIYPSK